MIKGSKGELRMSTAGVEKREDQGESRWQWHSNRCSQPVSLVSVQMDH